MKEFFSISPNHLIQILSPWISWVLGFKYCITINFKFKPWMSLHSFSRSILKCWIIVVNFLQSFIAAKLKWHTLKATLSWKPNNKKSLLNVSFMKAYFSCHQNFVYYLKYITLQNDILPAIILPWHLPDFRVYQELGGQGGLTSFLNLL